MSRPGEEAAAAERVTGHEATMARHREVVEAAKQLDPDDHSDRAEYIREVAAQSQDHLDADAARNA